MRMLLAIVVLGGLAQGPVSAQSTPTESRGRLLYANHCIACHTTQMHWRERKLVTDWASLKVQVRRWQGAAQLNWSEGEIDDVARYLNDTFYRLAAGKLAWSR